MLNPIVRFFDRLEDKVRARLSHRSIYYAFIGGAMTVLFWRGVWHTADILMAKGGFWGAIFYEPYTIVWTSLVLLVTGLFVSGFIGDRIVISGLKNEKKVTDRTEDEIKKEEDRIEVLNAKLNKVIRELDGIKDDVAKK